MDTERNPRSRAAMTVLAALAASVMPPTRSHPHFEPLKEPGHRALREKRKKERQNKRRARAIARRRGKNRKRGNS